MIPFKKHTVFMLFLVGIIVFNQCTTEGSNRKENKEKLSQQNKAESILTTRTMGLAFLEENKLEEAEQEFLKLTSLVPDEAIGYANLGLVYLRMGRYADAERSLLTASDLTPLDPDIRLNLATVYKYQNENKKFLEELNKAIEADPGHIQSIYRIAEFYSGTNEKSVLLQREKFLNQALNVSPANIVIRLHLIDVLLKNNKSSEALLQLEEIARIFPELPQEAREYYNKAFDAIMANKDEEALTSALIFHNFLKLTSLYNKGITELKGFEGTSIGSPIFTFSEVAPLFISEGESILDAIRFTDVTESAGLAHFTSSNETQLETSKTKSTHIAMGDFDHNGTDDLYVGTYMVHKKEYEHFLLKSEMGRFKDVSEHFGLKHHWEESQAIFTDYDNDGWFDLLVMTKEKPILYKSVSEGKYEDVSKKAFARNVQQGSKGLYFDMDHEGDLDLFISSPTQNSLLRNNGDGTFTDYTERSGLGKEMTGSRDACFGDFDDDGDVDLITVNQDMSCDLFTNLREGKFSNNTSGSGLQEIANATMIASGDYNNDGFLDLFVAGTKTESFAWLTNSGNGKFETVKMSESGSWSMVEFMANDADFFDFDNDGYLDLLIIGNPGSGQNKGGLLLHNDGTGGFKNVSQLLPDDLEGGRQIALADYNEDGDLDIFLAGLNGGVRLLRNDGGNANHHLKIRLLGVRSGSGKNNHYGIGAKIELRAGNLYQTKVVTTPNIYFGLADRSDVDVVRILWTNGTPQNIFSPSIEKDLIEEQQLKGSCPFLYAWNGTEYVFVKDIMWRSALGMPLGIMGEEQAYAFADASQDYHLIDGNLLKPKNGKYSIQITDELWETVYFDDVQLIAVDHPDSVDIYVDEKFVPPPYPTLKIHHVSHKITPEKALDGYGNEVTELLIKKDDRYVAGFKKGRYQGMTEMRNLILDPGTPLQTDRLFLFLNGWIFPTDASINLALSQGENERIIAPYLQVKNQVGQWETIIDNIGFPQGKDKTIIADLSGKFLSENHQVRICTNMEIYWDHIFFSSTLPDAPLITSHLDPVKADHHFRGFSRTFRKGGRYGPHWFDYETVTTTQKWRDLSGTYTRYGDVVELLQDPDNQYIISNAGDETTIEFDASSLQTVPEGWSRDFLIYSSGWVKDGDMNTAQGNRVGPLPFHGMTQYPYNSNESYPKNRELKQYHKKYNTREVTDHEFRRMLFEMQ